MNDKVPCSSTKLIRGGTAYSSSPFELNLQLHGQVNNPYSFSIKQNYKSSATTKVNIPPYTEKSWTTPGTYTWTVPAGVTKIKVEVAGAGGGGAHWKFLFENDYSGGNGDKKTSSISIVRKTSYSVVVGKGGNGTIITGLNIASAGTGGTSSFSDISAQGGTGARCYKNGSKYTVSNGTSAGNGQGGPGGNGNSPGANGWVKIAYGEGIE